MKTAFTAEVLLVGVVSLVLWGCGEQSVDRSATAEDEQSTAKTVEQALTPVPGCVDSTFGGHDYRYCFAFVPWQEARNRCLSYGLDLTRVDNQAENDFVALLGNPVLPRWIGANDRTQENNWRWSAFDVPFFQGTAPTGAPINGLYENFPPWEPVPDGGALDCANIRPFTAGAWFTTHCLEFSTFVCETFDECPNDPAKTVPGQCGCSIPDTDQDADGVANCRDGCPADPNKSQPLSCGCGRPETDSDSDGRANCVDGCPNDPTNAECNARDGLPPPKDVPHQPGATPLPDRDFNPNNCTPETGALDPSAPPNGAAILAGTPNTGAACGRVFDPGACPLDPNQVLEFGCETDADCAPHGPQYRCDYGKPSLICNVPNPPVEPCANKTRRCGIPDAACMNDPLPDGCTDPVSCPCINPNSPACSCVEIDVCPNPGYTGTANPGPGAYTPEVPPPPPGIAEERVDPPPADYFDPRDGDPATGQCRRKPISGSCWCALGMDDPGAIPAVHGKTGNHGAGSFLNLTFKPEIDFNVNIDPLPFGDAMFNANASAKFLARADVAFPPGQQGIDLIDLNAGVSAQRCGLSTIGAHFKVFGVDFVDLFTNQKFNSFSDLPAESAACGAAQGNFIRAGDRAKKALRDAQVLIQKYRALPPGQTFSKASFCDNNFHVGDSTDAQFPPGSCLNDPVETTINRYVTHYQNQIPLLRTAMEEFATASHNLVGALDGIAPGSSFRFLNFGRSESETIANFTFFVGPIPINVTMDVGLNYGVTGDLVYRYSPASGLGLAPGATTQVVAVAGKLIPSAASTFHIFAGVGIDLGVVAAKAGISGALTLASIQANLECGVGLSMRAADDNRAIPPELAALGTGSRLFPTKEYEFFLDWFYGAKLGLTDVLAGDISAMVKLKAFLFSKTYRKPMLHFNSPFNLPETQLISGGDRLPGIVLPTPSGAPANSLGLFEMELPFVDVTPLPPATGTPNPAAIFNLGSDKLHFHTVCDNAPPP